MKKMNYPFLDQAFLNDNFYSERKNPLMNLLKDERNYNIFIPHSGKNNGNVLKSVEYYITPVDRSTGKSVPNCLIEKTTEYQSYDPSMLDNMLIDGISESYEVSQDTKRGKCPWCKYFTSPPNKIEPQEKSEFCPFCNLLTGNKRFHKTELCPCCKSTINDKMQLKNDLNIKNTKRTRSPVSIILLIVGNGKLIANEDDKKSTESNLKFDNILDSGKHFPKDKKQVTKIPVNKNNRWTKKENKLIDLIVKKIEKQDVLKEFDEFGNINNLGGKKVSKKYISPFIRKSQNNDGDKKPIKNFKSVSFFDSEHKKVGQEKKYGNEEPPFYESRNKMSKTNFDASIIKTAPRDEMNEQQVESTYSVKMDIKPILQDKLLLKKSSINFDNNLIGSDLDSYDGPNSFSLYSNKDNEQKEGKIGVSKFWSRGVKRDIKQGQTLLKNSDLEIMKTEPSNDELEKNEIPHDESLISFKINLSPKNMGQDRNIISPVKVIPTLTSQDEIGTNDKVLQSLLEGSSKRVKIPFKIAIPDSDKQNHEDFKVFTSDFGNDFKDQPEGKYVKIISTSLPNLPLNDGHSKNVAEPTQLQNAKPQLIGLPTSNPTPNKILLHTSPKSKEDRSITSTIDNQTTTPDPHLEELSFWSKISQSIMDQIAPLLRISGLD